MQITIIEYAEKKVYLSEIQIKDITKQKLKSMLNGGEWLRTKDGKKIITKDEDGWRHGSVSEDYVRDATELDLAIFKVLEFI